MAFIPLAALGGAAKSLSKGLKDERDEALKNAGIKIKLLTEMGLPKARARKAKMKSKNDLYDKLDDHFSAPQIAKILQEDKGQAVLDHIDKQRNTYADYKVKPNDIVTLMDEYADLNLTKDQILENVMGKVGRGMTVTDAMKDVAGKGSSLTSFFGGDLSGIGKRQFDSIASATGVSMEELQALASDNITYDDPLVKGTITLSDPADQARAKKALQEPMTGTFSSPVAESSLKNHGYIITGGKATNATMPDTGEILYQPSATVRVIDVNKKAQEIQAAYQTKLGKNRFTSSEMLAMKEELEAWAISKGIHISPPDPTTTPPGGGTGTGSGSGAAKPQYLGNTTRQVSNSVLDDIQALNKSDPNYTVTANTYLAQAQKAIEADLLNTNSPADAKQKAEDIIEDIRSKI